MNRSFEMRGRLQWTHIDSINSNPLGNNREIESCGINEVCRVDCGLANGTGEFHSLYYNRDHNFIVGSVIEEF